MKKLKILLLSMFLVFVGAVSVAMVREDLVSRGFDTFDTELAGVAMSLRHARLELSK